jgi:hypothetical protein
MTLNVGAFVANERLPLGALYILREGMVVRLWRFHGANAVWGEDVLLDNRELMCHTQAVAHVHRSLHTYTAAVRRGLRRWLTPIGHAWTRALAPAHILMLTRRRWPTSIHCRCVACGCACARCV